MIAVTATRVRDARRYAESKREWTPEQWGLSPVPLRIVLTSHYGTLCRGRHSARIGNGDAAQWAEKDADKNIVITSPGRWQLHCSDGFSRQARAVLVVREDGDWEMSGDTKRFDVLAG